MIGQFHKLMVAITIVGSLWQGISFGEEYADTRRKDSYTADWIGWETRPLEQARQHRVLVYEADFSVKGLLKDWVTDGVVVEPADRSAVISLSPEAAASGSKFGVLWCKGPISPPFMIEIEFTLDPDNPHDANVLWGQKVLSLRNMGKEQECYVAGFFGWGGKSCGISRASDWYSYGITGALDPKPGKRQRGIWIINGRIQCMYLENTLVLYCRTLEDPPPLGYFGLEVYLSKVTYHSLKVYRPAFPKK
jgi:hypothetical protein